MGQSEREVLHLEDGIKLDYSSPLARAKMLQCALAVGPLLESLINTLDGTLDGPLRLDMTGLDSVRASVIIAIRRCLDITTFQRSSSSQRSTAQGREGAGHGDERGRPGRDRDRSRYCGDDAARFATYGEGHCHTVTSVMTGFLYPFSELLGLDLQYREDTGGHHQWLDVVMRPSMVGLVVDLYRADGFAKAHKGHDGHHLLTTPTDEHYAGADASSSDYPCLKPRPLSGKPVVLSALEDGDVEDAPA